MCDLSAGIWDVWHNRRDGMSSHIPWELFGRMVVEEGEMSVMSAWVVSQSCKLVDESSQFMN